MSGDGPPWKESHGSPGTSEPVRRLPVAKSLNGEVERRYHTGRTEGYASDTSGWWYEVEFGVYDSAYNCERIAAFIAGGKPGSDRLARRTKKARGQAITMVRHLNLRERGQPYNHYLTRPRIVRFGRKR